jgi:hypothetical protein
MAPEHFLQLAEAIEFSGFSAATRTVLQIAYEFLSMVALGELHKGVKKSPRSWTIPLTLIILFSFLQP